MKSPPANVLNWQAVLVTTRAKALMGLQATAALLTSLLVIARAVGSLGGGSG